ncbi:sterol-4-alpha-carboxylate 3-dehydrogenase, decarboxylating [Syncephalis fuscata]|nr:sterol-4-alpha-carboxylate 3-dehydrogenase, decarboxylating [Syncephalis fuscata]
MLQETYLVIGGDGFLGRHIVDALAARKEQRVRVFDLRQTVSKPPACVEYFVGDICKQENVERAVDGATIVIHTASAIFAGNPELMRQVNIEGTRNVIAACQKYGVKKLVYTSTCSTVFTTNGCFNANETKAYPDVPVDKYTETKVESEKLVLAANGQQGLFTCSLRPSGIFGPQDRLLLPRMLDVGRTFQRHFQVGDNSALADFTYVGNVADAHLLAADKLDDPKVQGEIFNITNGQPLPFWDFAQRVWAVAGLERGFVLVLPAWFALFLATIVDFFCFLLRPIKELDPNLSRFKIKLAVAHRYYDINKARKILGYKPRVDIDDGIKRGVQWLKEQEDPARKQE